MPTPVFVDTNRATLWIAARTPGARLNQDIDMARSRHAEETEAQQPAESPDPRIALATSAAHRTPNGKPDLITSRRSIGSLEYKLEVEAELQLTDNYIMRHIVA